MPVPPQQISLKFYATFYYEESRLSNVRISETLRVDTLPKIGQTFFITLIHDTDATLWSRSCVCILDLPAVIKITVLESFVITTFDS